MSVNRIAALLTVVLGISWALPAFAADDEHEGATADKVKYRIGLQVEAGGALINNAAGNHTLRLYGGVRGSLRPAYLLTFNGGYGLAYFKEGPSEVSSTTLLHKLYGRADLSWGTVTRQFYVGAGPAVFAQQFAIDDGSTRYNGMLIGPGIVYATGFRIALGNGHIPMAIEFGGQYHHARNDFMVTLLVGAGLFTD